MSGDDRGNRRTVNQYTPEFVAQVMAEYSKGVGYNALSKKYRIPDLQIRRWATQYGIQRGATLSQNAREKIGEKVMELLLMNIDAEIRIVRKTEDQEWMSKQSAGDLALFYATIHDKNIHLLSSMQSKMNQQRDDNALMDDLGEEGIETWDESYPQQNAEIVVEGDILDANGEEIDMDVE